MDQEVMQDIATTVATIGTIVGFVISASETISKFLLSTFNFKLDGVAAKAVSWIVSFASAFIVSYFDPSYFSNFPTNDPLVLGTMYGLMIALVSNGLFSLEKVKSFLTIIRLRKR